MIAKDLMTTPVVTIEENSTVEKAARLMLDEDISALPVLNSSGKVVGILTHSDFGLSPKFRPLMENVFSMLGSTTTPRHLEETAHKVGGKLVRDVMRRHVITASQDTDMEHIAQLMLRANIHRLPIVDGDRLVGIITRHDFLKLIVSSE
ncbi:MAG: CBS domain-containing protein [Chloroflexi bacterium]|nr:CBS domain-containing protein [Chloroflexota bacterium]